MFLSTSRSAGCCECWWAERQRPTSTHRPPARRDRSISLRERSTVPAGRRSPSAARVFVAASRSGLLARFGLCPVAASSFAGSFKSCARAAAALCGVCGRRFLPGGQPVAGCPGETRLLRPPFLDPLLLPKGGSALTPAAALLARAQRLGEDGPPSAPIPPFLRLPSPLTWKPNPSSLPPVATALSGQCIINVPRLL